MPNPIGQLNIKSAAFWSSVAGVISVLCGALKVDGSFTSAVQSLLVAIGGVFIAIPAHHVVKSQQQKKTAA